MKIESISEESNSNTMDGFQWRKTLDKCLQFKNHTSIAQVQKYNCSSRS